MRIAHGTLVLVIDGEKLLLLRNEGDRKYIVLETIDCREIANPAAREQGSDAPGRVFASVGTGRSAYDETDRHRQLAERFALEGIDALKRAVLAEDSDIVVVAPPRTLGVLRKHWPAAIEERVIAEIGKDLVHHESDDIAAQIAAH